LVDGGGARVAEDAFAIRIGAPADQSAVAEHHERAPGPGAVKTCGQKVQGHRACPIILPCACSRFSSRCSRSHVDVDGEDPVTYMRALVNVSSDRDHPSGRSVGSSLAVSALPYVFFVSLRMYDSSLSFSYFTVFRNMLSARYVRRSASSI